MLNYHFTLKNNVFTMVVLFIVMKHLFFIIISLTKEATFPYIQTFFFLAQVSVNYYSNNVKLLSLSNNKVSITEKQITLKGMVINGNQQC